MRSSFQWLTTVTPTLLTSSTGGGTPCASSQLSRSKCCSSRTEATGKRLTRWSMARLKARAWVRSPIDCYHLIGNILDTHILVKTARARPQLLSRHAPTRKTLQRRSIIDRDSISGNNGNRGRTIIRPQCHCRRSQTTDSFPQQPCYCNSPWFSLSVFVPTSSNEEQGRER